MKIITITLALIACTMVPLSAKDVDIAVKELPEVVTAAIMKAHPDATILSAEKDLKMDDSIQHFEVKVRVGKEEKELTVLPDGKITDTEKD